MRLTDYLGDVKWQLRTFQHLLEEHIRTSLNSWLFQHDLKRSFTFVSVSDMFFLLTFDQFKPDFTPVAVAEFTGGQGEYFASYEAVHKRLEKLQHRGLDITEEKKAINAFLRKRLIAA